MKRTKEDDCLLCKNEKAIRTNSHIVPAPLLDNVHGERNKEHSFVFSTSESSVDEYYGRQFPQENSTEIKKPNFSYDHILCDKCEKFFGRLESLCNTLLKNIDSELDNNKIKDLKLNNIDFKEIQHLNPGLIQLYFYSIIWRLIIQDYIENDSFAKQIVPTEEKLRQILNRFKDCDEKQLKEINLEKDMCLKVITTKQELFPIGQFFNSSTDNPYFFIAGRFLLYLFDLNRPLDSKNQLILNQIENIANYGVNKFKIIYLPNDKYKMIISVAQELFLDKLGPEKTSELKKDLDTKIRNIDKEIN